MTRMQVVFRQGVGEVTPSDWNRRQVERETPKTSLAWAYVEAEPNRFTPEKAYDFVMSMGSRGLSMDLSGAPSRINDPYDDETIPVDADVSSAFTAMRIQGTGFRNLLTFGRMFMRETEFPHAAGSRAFVACGIVVNSGTIPDGVRFELSGDGRLVETTRTPVPQAIEIGMAATMPYGTPIWGFGGEPRAFVSTMHREVIAVCARFTELDRLLDRTPSQEAERERLSAHPHVKSVFGSSNGSADFVEWKRYVRESGRWDQVMKRMDSFPTASELEDSRAAMEEAFSDWTASRESTPGP